MRCYAHVQIRAVTLMPGYGGKLFLKEEIRVAVIALAMLAAGLLSWMADELTGCRDYEQRSGMFSAVLFLKSGCNETGPYNSNRIAWPFAKLPGFALSRSAHQQQAFSP
jgi:hypothetical protein